jgi:hypothetical protein
MGGESPVGAALPVPNSGGVLNYCESRSITKAVGPPFPALNGGEIERLTS